MTRRVAVLAALLIAAPTLEAQQFPTTPPAAAPIKPAPFPPFQEATLPNGMRLVLVESHEQPVVSISLSMPAGDIYDPAGKEGVATMVAGLLTKGAGKRSADEIAEAIEGVGGSLNASSGEDFLTLTANVLTPDAPLAFELVSDAVMRPAFPASEVELLRTQTLSGLQLEMSQPGALASRFFAKTLYGSHPYGRRQTPETVRAITRADLVAFQRARLRPSGSLLVIAGDLTLADARRLAAQAFGSWAGAAPTVAAAARPVPARSATEILLVHRPGSVQSNILVGNTTFAPADPRYYGAVVANRVLGGGADSRLFTILREQKSWTYGSYSAIQRMKGVGYFQASAEVRTEVTDSALAELMTQLKRIRTEPVSAVELEAAKGALVGSFPLTIETASQVAGAVATAKLLGLPPNYLASYRTRLAAITPAQLTAGAQATIRPDASVIVVVGDATKLHDKLEKIAPVRMVSVEGKPLAAADLVIKAGALDLDMSKLVPRRDSFTIMVQGNPFGFQTNALEKSDDGWRYTANAQLATLLQETSELRFTDKIEMKSLAESGKFQGQDTKTELTYADGRVKGSAMTPTPAGTVETKSVDAEVPAGVLDDNALQAVLPALKWGPNAKWTLPVFSGGEATLRQLTLSVAGTESVTVPAGTFETYRVEVTGGQAPRTFYVTTAAPHRLVKVSTAGVPIEFVLAK